MAIVIADQVDRANKGERRLFEVLRKVFEDQRDCILWAEPSITVPRPDFIVWSPRLGLIIIEVKDWSADSILAATATEWQVQWGQTFKSCTNPGIQVRNALMSLRTRLERESELLQKDGRYAGKLAFPMNHFVAFTNMTTSEFRICSSKLEKTLSEDCGVLFAEDIHLDCSTLKGKETFLYNLRNRIHWRFDSTLPPDAVHVLQQAISPSNRRPDPPPSVKRAEQPAYSKSSWNIVQPSRFLEPRRRVRTLITRRAWIISIFLLIGCFVGLWQWLHAFYRQASTRPAVHLILTANPDVVLPGQRVDLRWESSGYVQVKLDGKDIAPNGSATVIPWSSTKHFLVGYRGGGQVDSTELTVRVSRSKRSSTPRTP